MKEFIKFAEFFLAGLFTADDLQEHVIEAQCQIKQINYKITEVVKTLKDKCSIIDEENNRLNKKYKELGSEIKIA